VKVLLVEDSKTFGSIIKKTIESELHFAVDWVLSYSDAVQLITDNPAEYFVALLDLHLPDASEGEIVDLILSKNIPPIIFTGKFGDDIREYIWSRQVVDYVLKDNPYSVDYVMSLIERIYRNKSAKVLVVEDSAFSRKHLCKLLQVHQYHVLESSSGKKALKILDEHPDIKLAIIDYYMPDMDGLELTRRIREKFPKEEFAIIGISAQGSNIISAQFLKHGANDFITKPFVNEEFYCRITQNIEMLEYLDKIKIASHKDFLTNLYNRRYFFESGQLLYANSVRKNITISVAMLDIDHFKHINDTYGHKTGDAVLQQIAWTLRKRFRSSDIVSRFGGEEFCILTSNMDPQHAYKVFDEVREMIKQLGFSVNNDTIHVTISIGVCTQLKRSLEEMINEADKMLFEAKRQGRDQVICS
jgi:diguanylate cyclase (GGDEF)-like protein